VLKIDDEIMQLMNEHDIDSDGKLNFKMLKLFLLIPNTIILVTRVLLKYFNIVRDVMDFFYLRKII
jgi:hypothetical protein